MNITTNKIYNENCEGTMGKMQDNYIDMIITSPPYNIGKNRSNHNKNGKENYNYDNYKDNLSFQEYKEKFSEWIENWLRITKHYIFINISEYSGNKGIIKHIYEKYGDNLKKVFIWAKTTPTPTPNKGNVINSYEYILCLTKDKNEAGKIKFNYSNISRNDFVKDVIIKSTYKKQQLHPYAFPLWLPRYFICWFSKSGDLIYDPFMGSGTTAVASILEKRAYIGSEISEKYIKIAEKRIYQTQKQKGMF